MNMQNIIGVLKKPLVQAALIAIVFIVWMSTGDSSPQRAEKEMAESTQVIPKVRVQQFNAELVARTITLYGRTAADRETNLGAEWPGRIATVLAKRGSYVKQGDVIAKMEINDLPQQLNRAKTLYKQRNIEYLGAQKLAVKGFQGKANLAAAEAALSDASASVYSLQLQIDKTTITAPISGILNERHVEVGDFVAKGNPIATIADINPVIVKADVTETDIEQVQLKQKADVRFVNGEVLEGSIRYISRVANADTNTYRIEVAVDNKDGHLSVGGSAEVSLPLSEEWAVKLSPATLALNEAGDIGVKTVVDERVVFTPIDILKADATGSWLTGLGQSPVVITVGQGFVRNGDLVNAIQAGEL